MAFTLAAVLVVVPATAETAPEVPAATQRLADLLAGAPAAPALPWSLDLQLLVDRGDVTPAGRHARLVVRVSAREAGTSDAIPAFDLELGVRDLEGRVRSARRSIVARAARLYAIDLAVPAGAVAAAAVISDAEGGRGEAVCEPVVADLGPLPGVGVAPRAAREPPAPPPVSLLLPPDAVLAGRTEVGAGVSIPGVARLRFLLDGGVVAETDREPWRARVPFDPRARPQTLEVVALGPDGRELGRDASPVNEPADEAWLRILPPRADAGRTLVTVRLRPAARHTLRSLEIFAGERLLAVLSREPYEVPLPAAGSPAPFLHAVAVFDDADVVEDVLQESGGTAGEAVDVERVELLPRFFDAKKRPVAVRAEDLTVLEEGAERPIEEVVPGRELPLLLGIVVDDSGSMQPYANRLQGEIEALLGQLVPGRDRAFLVVFAANSVLAQPPTTDPARIARALRGVEARGQTALYDALAHGLFQFDRRRSLRALIVLTDGENTTGRMDEPRVIEIAKRLGVPIFAVFPTEESLNYFARPAMRSLGRITQQSGGALVPFGDPDTLAGELRRLFERLRAETLVTFVPSGARPEKATWRKVEIRPRRPGIRVEGELGYFAGAD